MLIHKLLEYCNVAAEIHLPGLWLLLANSSKKQDINILQDEVTNDAVGPNGFGWTALIISPQLVQDLVSPIFVVPSADDIKTGLQPFMVINGTKEHRANNIEVAQDYGFLVDGAVGISYDSLTSLRVKETRSLSVTFFE